MAATAIAGAAVVAASAMATGLTVQMCAVLLWGVPRAAALATVARSPTASLQRLTEAEWNSYHERDHQGPGTYAFGYDIEDPETGNTQFRQEERHPNGTVTGSYGLVLPDGSIQIVHYTADHLGYRARIETKPGRHRARVWQEKSAPALPAVVLPAAASLGQPAFANLAPPTQSAFAFPVATPPASPPLQPVYSPPRQPDRSSQTATYAPVRPSYFAEPPSPVRSYAGSPPPAPPPLASQARFAPQNTFPVPSSASAGYQPMYWIPQREVSPSFASNYV